VKFSSGKLADLTGFPASVEELELYNLRRLKSFRGMPAGSQLRDLRVERCRGLVSLEGLQNCRRLKLFTIPGGGSGPFPDLEPLRPLQELEFLCLPAGTVEEPANLDALYGLPRLQTLMIDEAAGVEEKRVHQSAPQCGVVICPNPQALRRWRQARHQAQQTPGRGPKARIYYPSEENRLETAILVASVAEGERAWALNCAEWDVEGITASDTVLITLGKEQCGLWIGPERDRLIGQADPPLRLIDAPNESADAMARLFGLDFREDVETSLVDWKIDCKPDLTDLTGT
jgi:hypothetical protein